MRYPLEPLANALGIQLGRPGRPEGNTTGAAAALAEHLGITTKQVHNRSYRGLTDHEADDFAIRCGFFPFEIWPTWCDDATTADHEAA